MSAAPQRPHGLGPHAIGVGCDDWQHVFVLVGENVYFSQPRAVDVDNPETGLTILSHAGALALADAITGKLRPSSRRDQALTVEIAEGRLLVSIGIDALMVAVRGGDDWDDETMTIVDADVFATEIAHALEHNEQEDGTTHLHLAIDAAAEHAIESGSDAVRLEGSD